MNITKFLYAVAVATAFSFGVSAVRSQSANMDEINALVNKLVERGAQNVDNSVEQYELITSPEFIQLQNLCRANWHFVVDNFAGISNGDDGKTAIIAAFEALDPGDYMSVLETLGARFAQAQLSKRLMLAAISPKGRMRAFLPDNYQHPRVRAFLNQANSRFASNDPIKTEISAILSGQLKNQLDDFRSAYQGTADGDIPRIILPAN